MELDQELPRGEEETVVQEGSKTESDAGGQPLDTLKLDTLKVGTHGLDAQVDAHGEQFKLFKEDFSLLIEAGFVAVKQLDEVSASRLFHAAQVVSPQSVAPRIGLGYIALNKLEVREATGIFEKILEEESDNQLAGVFLAICYLLTKTKRSKGEALLQDLLQKATDPVIVNFAKVSMEWAQNDLRAGRTKIAYDDGSRGEAKVSRRAPRKGTC